LAFKLGAKSLAELEGVHPSLVAVVKRAIELTTQDFTVFDGLRTIEEQKEHVRKGNSQTMKSKHLEGRAVDLVPWINNGPRWEPLSAFAPIATAMRAAAKELGVPLEYGGDWVSFKDYPHWQLPDGWEPKGAPQPTPKPSPAPAPPDKPLRPIPEAETITHRDVKKTGKQGLLIVILAAIGGIIGKVFGWW
jgi:peptidoglycan L-alanyl-D-glutamate endopeptidase CwlK